MEKIKTSMYPMFPFASMTIIGANGVIDSIDCTTASPKEAMEFCERNLEKLGKNNK